MQEKWLHLHKPIHHVVMRKYLLLIATVATLVLTGCSKDEGNDALAGTTWNCTYTDGNYSSVEYLIFASASKCTYTMLEKQDGEVITDISANGTYSYNPPTLIVSVTYQGETATKKLTVSGNEMTDGEYTFVRR